MADTAVERIQKLIRLALNNPNEAEAKSAALKACRLIDEHKVTLRLPRMDMYESVRVELQRQERWEPFTASRGQQKAPDFVPRNYTPPPPMSTCVFCHQVIYAGQPVIASGTNSSHTACALAEQMKQQRAATATQQAAEVNARRFYQPSPTDNETPPVLVKPTPWWGRIFA